MMLGLVSGTTNKMKSYIGILNGRKGFQKDMDTFNIVDSADVVEINNRRTENGERRTCCGLYYGYSVWYDCDFAFWTSVSAKGFGHCVGGSDEVCGGFGQFSPFSQLAANNKSCAADRG